MDARVVVIYDLKYLFQLALERIFNIDRVFVFVALDLRFFLNSPRNNWRRLTFVE